MEFQFKGQTFSLEEAVALIQMVLDQPQELWDQKWQEYFDATGTTNPRVTDPRLCPLCSNLGWTLSPDSWDVQPCACIRHLPQVREMDQRRLESAALAHYGCNYRTIRAEQK